MESEGGTALPAWALDAQPAPAAVAALRRVEEQAGPSTAARATAVHALRAFCRYACAGARERRPGRIDTESDAFRQRLGACPAALDVLALCGFRPASGGRAGLLSRSADSDDPSEGVVRAVEDTAVRLAAPGPLSPARGPGAPGGGAAAELGAERRTSERRHPLTKRLPKVDHAAAAEGSLLAEQQHHVGAAATIAGELRSGESTVCGACGGVVSISRYEQHLQTWCAATCADDAEDDG